MNQVPHLILFCTFVIFCDHAQSATLCFEAEDTISLTPHFEKKADPSVSKGHYIEIAQGKGEKGGEARYSFTINQEDRYYIWMRVWWIDSCGNSVAVVLNDMDKKPLIFGQNGTYKTWHWFKSKVKLPLKVGEHEIKLLNREDGIKIDQILLTTDRRFVPVDIEKSNPSTSAVSSAAH